MNEKLLMGLPKVETCQALLACLSDAISLRMSSQMLEGYYGVELMLSGQVAERF